MSASLTDGEIRIKRTTISKFEVDKYGQPVDLRKWDEDVRSYLTQTKSLRFLKKQSSKVATGKTRLSEYITRDIIDLEECRHGTREVIMPKLQSNQSPSMGTATDGSGKSLASSVTVKEEPAKLEELSKALTKVVSEELGEKETCAVIRLMSDEAADFLLDFIKSNLEPRELKTLNEMHIFLHNGKVEEKWEERAKVWRELVKSIEGVKTQVIAGVTHYDNYGLYNGVMNHYDQQSRGKLEVKYMNKLFNIRLGKNESIASFHERWCVAVKDLKDNNLWESVTETRLHQTLTNALANASESIKNDLRIFQREATKSPLGILTEIRNQAASERGYDPNQNASIEKRVRVRETRSRGRGRGTGRGRGASGRGRGKPASSACFEYRDKGSCSYGEECNFSHDDSASDSRTSNLNSRKC